MSIASSRVGDKVEKAYPRVHSLEELKKADQDIKAFDRLNGETIRQSGLVISVSPEVAARLKVAYTVQDEEVDRLRNQSQLSTELYKQEWAFDPINLQVGRAAIDLFTVGLGIAMVITSTVSMWRRARNNRG